jgi:hypothetical protein
MTPCRRQGRRPPRRTAFPDASRETPRADEFMMSPPPPRLVAPPQPAACVRRRSPAGAAGSVARRPPCWAGAGSGPGRRRRS